MIVVLGGPEPIMIIEITLLNLSFGLQVKALFMILSMIRGLFIMTFALLHKAIEGLVSNIHIFAIRFFMSRIYLKSQFSCSDHHQE